MRPFPESPGGIVWSFAMLDQEGPFGWQHCKPEAKYFEILVKKGQFEGMNLSTLRAQGSHPVETYKLSKPARDRLVEIRLDDHDELFSLRLTGTNRIWCIQSDNVMRVLWWDPEHQVCPSPKKHT